MNAATLVVINASPTSTPAYVTLSATMRNDDDMTVAAVRVQKPAAECLLRRQRKCSDKTRSILKRAALLS